MSNKTTLIQTDLPKLCVNEKPLAESSKANTAASPEVNLQANSKAKWNYLKSDLKSAVSDWTELEANPKKKTPEEEQLEKVRGLLSNLKDRLLEF